MEMKDMFAGRRKGFLAEAHPDVYAAMEAAGELPEHLETNATEAVEIMNGIVQHYQAELDAMEAGEAKEIRRGQILMSAREIALAEIVLVL